MIENIGIDIVYNERIKKNVSNKFLDIVLTTKERTIYNKKVGKKKLEFLCGRYAAKEALIKAINKYENPHFLEIEILNEKNGSPVAIYKDYNFLISISHETEYSIAEVILLKR